MRGPGLQHQNRHEGPHLSNENSITGLLMPFVLCSRGTTRLRRICVTVLLANDPQFAAPSGTYQRYHDRALFLLWIPELLAMNELR
jgi:hypothetical protein